MTDQPISDLENDVCAALLRLALEAPMNSCARSHIIAAAYQSSMIGRRRGRRPDLARAIDLIMLGQLMRAVDYGSGLAIDTDLFKWLQTAAKCCNGEYVGPRPTLRQAWEVFLQ